MSACPIHQQDCPGGLHHACTPPPDSPRRQRINAERKRLEALERAWINGTALAEWLRADDEAIYGPEVGG